MTRPLHLPFGKPMGGARRHFRTYGRVYGDASIVVGTLLFLALGVIIAVTMLPNLR
jgi:hypothetical protein